MSSVHETLAVIPWIVTDPECGSSGSGREPVNPNGSSTYGEFNTSGRLVPARETETKYSRTLWGFATVCVPVTH